MTKKLTLPKRIVKTLGFLVWVPIKLTSKKAAYTKIEIVLNPRNKSDKTMIKIGTKYAMDLFVK